MFAAATTGTMLGRTMTVMTRLAPDTTFTDLTAQVYESLIETKQRHLDAVRDLLMEIGTTELEGHKLLTTA